MQTQIQRPAGRKHGFLKNCKSFLWPMGSHHECSQMAGTGGLSFIPEGRDLNPFQITAHSQKGAHIRVHGRGSGEVVWPKVTPILANPYPSQEALQ